MLYFLNDFPGQQFKERFILLFQLQMNIYWVAKNDKIGVMGVKPSYYVYEVAILLFFFTFIQWLDQIVQEKILEMPLIDICSQKFTRYDY